MGINIEASDHALLTSRLLEHFRRSRRIVAIFRRLDNSHLCFRDAQFTSCECLRNGLKQMPLQQQTEPFFGNRKVRVMAKPGSDSGRNSRLLGIKLPRMEIRYNGLFVMLFKMPEDPFRV